MAKRKRSSPPRRQPGLEWLHGFHRVRCPSCGQQHDFGSYAVLYNAPQSLPCPTCGYLFLQHLDRRLELMMELLERDAYWQAQVRSGNFTGLARHLDELLAAELHEEADPP